MSKEIKKIYNQLRELGRDKNSTKAGTETRLIRLTERAVASSQALVEFNLCAPPEFANGDKSLKEFFETFWDSVCLRYGEAGALGWRALTEFPKESSKTGPLKCHNRKEEDSVNIIAVRKGHIIPGFAHTDKEESSKEIVNSLVEEFSSLKEELEHCNRINLKNVLPFSSCLGEVSKTDVYLAITKNNNSIPAECGECRTASEVGLAPGDSTAAAYTRGGTRNRKNLGHLSQLQQFPQTKKRRGNASSYLAHRKRRKHGESLEQLTKKRRHAWEDSRLELLSDSSNGSTAGVHFAVVASPPFESSMRGGPNASLLNEYEYTEVLYHFQHIFTPDETEGEGKILESVKRTKLRSSSQICVAKDSTASSLCFSPPVPQYMTALYPVYCSRSPKRIVLYRDPMGIPMGELTVTSGLYGTLQSSTQVKCCLKHFLLDCFPHARDTVKTTGCNDYEDGTAKFEFEELLVMWCPELKVVDEKVANSSLGPHAMNEDAAVSKLPSGTTSTAREVHPASQHPFIQNITPLLHANHYPEIVQFVDEKLASEMSCPVFPEGVNECLALKGVDERVDENLSLKDEDKVALQFIGGLAHFKLAQYKEARLWFNAAIDVCVSMGERGKGNRGLCSVYLGDTEFNSQRYLEAATHYKKATKLYSIHNVATLFRMVPPSLSIVHSKCGSALRNASKLVDGVQEYKLAIEKALTDKDRLAANTSLGNLYQSLGENTSALTHYEQSVHLSEKLLDYIALGWAHGNMGNAHLGLFQKDKALFHLQKSLDLTVEYEPTPQAIGRTYNNLGTAYQSMGDLDKAQDHYDLALSQAIYGDDIPGQARVYGNIGNVLMLRKKYPEAIPHYGEVLRLSKDRSTLSTAHHNRGCAYYEWAEKKMDDLLKLSNSESLSKLSGSDKFSKLDAGNGTDDIKFYVHGTEFASQEKHSPRPVIDSIAEYYRHGSDDLQEVVRYHEESLQNIKGSSKGLSLSISLFETNSRTFHRLQDCLVNLGEYPQALLVAEQSRARTLGELMLSRKGWSLPHPLSSPLGIDQVESTILARSHPVFYLSYTGARLLGWVFVPKDGAVKMDMFEVPLRDDQFSGKSFDHHVRYSLTEALVERNFEMYRGVTYDEESSKPVEYLYDLIAKPLLCILGEHLDLADIDKIVVISDSYTALLPYSCLRLHDTKGSSFLGDKISFQLMPSLLTMSVMDQLPDANIVRLPADALNMCIAGNPVVPQFMFNRDVWNLGKLPHARQEAEWVAHILKTTPILEEQATKSAILMRIMSAKVIHLATHGSASAGFLAFGAMVSVGGNAMVNSESVLLYPEDVEKLNISPALVVLSSCDSGRGTVKADGIQGMARAFILAGAQAVLTTLWRVPDESAAVFMQFFYQYMVDGMESTLALRKAILSVRCFSKYSQYIHWSGYQLTGRDVWFKSSAPNSAQVLIQRLGPSSAFPRLKMVKELEAALVKNPCFPTDVQILQGCPGVKPSEVVTDFIHNSHQHFPAGVFWINCRCQEFISASCNYIEQTLNTTLSQLRVTETSPALLVFDGMTTLPELKPLLQLMGKRHAHIVVLYTHYQPPDKLTRAIDRELLRGSNILTVDPLSMIHSTQRTVYTLQREIDFAPDNKDQDVLEKLAEFTSGSPVLVDITSQLLLSHLKSTQSHGDPAHIQCPVAGDLKSDKSYSSTKPLKPLEKFADAISLDTTRQSRIMYGTGSFVLREISLHMAGSVPSVTELNFEQRDEWDTKCQYDSWDSVSEVILASDLNLEEEILLNCVSIFGSNPIPVSLTTALSSLICKTSGRPHLASSLLQNLTKMSYVATYPLPVVIHPSITRPSVSGEPNFVYVPQYIANFLWKHLDDCDKVMALATSYRALSSLPTSTLQCSHFLLGLVSLLMDAYELNFDLMRLDCYREVYRLYLTLLPKSTATISSFSHT